jgi:spore germination cell wall hydrolase CwlJ-like protein
MNFNQDDIALLARCIWLEARGDGLTGMHAVAHCVKNRVGSPGFPATLHDVIMQHNAFSWTRPDNPEFNLQPTDVAPANLWSEAQRLAELVLTTDDADPTGGSHYYDNPKTATSGWFQRVIVADTVNHPMTVVIDHHTFYR